MLTPASFYRNRPVLVTGGAGFIGSHVVEKLVSLGAKVTVIDNLSTGCLDNLKNILSSITFLPATIEDYTLCKKAIQSQSIIIHLAAIVSVPYSFDHPKITHDTNVTGTLNLLEAARESSIDRFLFSSSSAVYGNAHQACHEDMPCNPLSPYGTSKYMGELYLKQYAHLYHISTLGMRFFNVTGQRQAIGKHTGVVAQWRQKLAHHEPITILGDGNQTRDFIEVTWVADTILKLATIDFTKGDIVNIASGKSTSLNQLFEQLKQEFPSYTLSPVYAPPRPGDIIHSSADCSKLFRLLSRANHY